MHTHRHAYPLACMYVLHTHTCRHAHPLACSYAFTEGIPAIKYQNDPRRKNPYFWWRISGVVTKRRRHLREH